MRNFKKKIKFLILAPLAWLSSCGDNAFEPYAQNSTTDEAVLYDVETLMNDQDYAGVISKIGDQSAAFKARTDVMEYLTEAYLGKCGFQFLDFFSDFGGVSDTQLFRKFTFAFSGRTISPSDCYTAQLKAEELSSSSEKKTMLLLFVGMAKFGTYLRASLDVDGSAGNGNGVAEKSACTTANISDANMKQVVTGLGLILQNFAGLIGDLLGADTSTAITTFLTDCEAALGAGNCSITDPTVAGFNNDVDTDLNGSNDANSKVLAFRAMIDASSTMGVGTCSAGENTTNDGDGQKRCDVPLCETNP